MTSSMNVDRPILFYSVLAVILFGRKCHDAFNANQLVQTSIKVGIDIIQYYIINSSEFLHFEVPKL